MSEPGAPADLVLLPGLNNTRAVFDGVLAALPPDLRGHAVDNPALPTVESIADALLPMLPARFWLAGFSFGGYVALAMLERSPERVQGLALVCTSPFADTPAQAQRRQEALAKVAEGSYFEMVEAQAANAFHPDSLRDAALMRARRRMVEDYGAQRYVAHVQATIARPDRLRLLDGRHPVAVIAGAQDAMFAPASLAAWAQRIPGASLQVIEHAGHLLPMEQPAALAQGLAQWVRGA